MAKKVDVVPLFCIFTEKNSVMEVKIAADWNGFFQAGSFQLNYARPEAGGYDNVEASNNMNRSYHYNVKMIIGIEPNE